MTCFPLRENSAPLPGSFRESATFHITFTESVRHVSSETEGFEAEHVLGKRQSFPPEAIVTLEIFGKNTAPSRLLAPMSSGS